MIDRDTSKRGDDHSSVRVVIVNYGTPRRTIDCLESLWDQIARRPGDRVDVVDNASPDHSVAELRAAIQARGWSSRISLLALRRNGGFAFGNNAAIRLSLARGEDVDYVLLLNPDTVVRPGMIGTLVDFMAANPRVGIAGSRLEDLQGIPQCSAYRAPSALGELAGGARLGILSRLLRNHVVPIPVKEEPHECDWVSGAAMIVRREVFDAIGLLDDRFFLYYEEVDFCRRARRAGWQVWHVPAARVVHLEGDATGIGDGRRRPAYWFESRRRYFLNHHGLGYAAAADLMRIAGLILWRMRRRLQNRPDVDPPCFLRDLVRHSVFLKGTRFDDAGSSLH